MTPSTVSSPQSPDRSSADTLDGRSVESTSRKFGGISRRTIVLGSLALAAGLAIAALSFDRKPLTAELRALSFSIFQKMNSSGTENLLDAFASGEESLRDQPHAFKKLFEGSVYVNPNEDFWKENRFGNSDQPAAIVWVSKRNVAVVMNGDGIFQLVKSDTESIMQAARWNKMPMPLTLPRITFSPRLSE